MKLTGFLCFSLFTQVFGLYVVDTRSGKTNESSVNNFIQEDPPFKIPKELQAREDSWKGLNHNGLLEMTKSLPEQQIPQYLYNLLGKNYLLPQKKQLPAEIPNENLKEILKYLNSFNHNSNFDGMVKSGKKNLELPALNRLRRSALSSETSDSESDESEESDESLTKRFSRSFPLSSEREAHVEDEATAPKKRTKRGIGSTDASKIGTSSNNEKFGNYVPNGRQMYNQPYRGSNPNRQYYGYDPYPTQRRRSRLQGGYMQAPPRGVPQRYKQRYQNNGYWMAPGYGAGAGALPELYAGQGAGWGATAPGSGSFAGAGAGVGASAAGAGKGAGAGAGAGAGGVLAGAGAGAGAGNGAKTGGGLIANEDVAADNLDPELGYNLLPNGQYVPNMRYPYQDVYDYQGRDYNDVEYYDYPQSLGMDYGAYYSWPYYGQQMVYPGMASRRQLSSASGSYRPTKGIKEQSSARRFIFPRHKSYVKLSGRRSAKSRYF